MTTTAAAVSVPQQTSVTTTTLVSNLETTIGEKERAIEKLREQKHTLEIEHQEELDQVQRILQETRTKLEQKEKDYYEGQVRLTFLLSFSPTHLSSESNHRTTRTTEQQQITSSTSRSAHSNVGTTNRSFEIDDDDADEERFPRTSEIRERESNSARSSLVLRTRTQ